MTMQKVLILRGVVDVPDVAFLAEQTRLNALSAGFGARTGAHLRRYRQGDTTMLPTGDAEQLQKLGIVRLCDDT